MKREADWAGTSLRHHPQLEKGPEIPDNSKIEQGEQEQVDRDEEEKKKRKKEGRMCSEEVPSARETSRTGQLTVIHRYRPSTNDNTPAVIVCVWKRALQANGLVLCRQKTPVRYMQIHTPYIQTYGEQSMPPPPPRLPYRLLLSGIGLGPHQPHLAAATSNRWRAGKFLYGKYRY